MLTIRKAHLADIPFITEVFNEAILTSTATFYIKPLDIANRQLWFTDLQTDNYPCLVAVESDSDDTLVGWCNLSRYRPREAYSRTVEISLYVHKDFRRRGVGASLLNNIITEARKLNFHTILGVVATENEDSCRFWEKHGFERCGVFRQVGRKFGRWLDTASYQFVLEADPEKLE